MKILTEVVKAAGESEREALVEAAAGEGGGGGAVVLTQRHSKYPAHI